MVHIILACVIATVVAVAWFERRPEVSDFDPERHAAYRDTWDTRVHIVYWEKWGSFEAEACQKMVDAFNESQDEIFCHYIRTSQVDRKAMLAIVGGDPPDIAGLWSQNVAPFAEADGLIALDTLMQQSGLTDDHYIPAYLDMCRYKGGTYALPSTPASIALFWNKQHFRDKAAKLRAAGLDPDRPPRTIDEIDRYADVLSEFAPDGTPNIMGFLPTEPGWFHVSWPYYFGGSLFDDDRNPTPDRPENIRAFEWLKSYANRYGRDNLTRFQQGFGNYDSPQNGFIDGKVSMVLHGVYFPAFIDRHRPHLEYGVVPFPPADGVPGPMSYLNQDVLAIPRNCKHPKEAWTFVHWVQTKGLPIVCRLQGKHLPLAHESEEFRQGHPNKFLDVFGGLARAPHSFALPTSIIWQEYNDAYRKTFDHIWHWQAPAGELAGLTGEAREARLAELTREEIVSTLRELREQMEQRLAQKLERSRQREGLK